MKKFILLIPILLLTACVPLPEKCEFEGELITCPDNPCDLCDSSEECNILEKAPPIVKCFTEEPTELTIPQKIEDLSLYKTVTQEEIDSLHAEPTNIHQSLPDHVVAMNQLREITRSVLATLTTREEKVIRQRFGINPGCKDQTLEEVGRDFEVTRDRIRQIEAKSLRKIRHPSRARSLKTFT